jgi:hypothetical protein
MFIGFYYCFIKKKKKKKEFLFPYSGRWHPYVAVRNFKSLRPQKSAVRNNYLTVTESSWRQRNPPVSLDVTLLKKSYPYYLGKRKQFKKKKKKIIYIC